MSIDREKRKISLGLKPSYFAEDDFDGTDADESAGEDEIFGAVEGGASTTENPDLDEALDGNDEDNHTDSDGSMQVDTDISFNQGLLPSASTKAPTPSLKFTGGFQWSGNGAPLGEDITSESSGESENDDQSGKKKKRNRRAIEQDLTADMHTKTPESNADFERLLLGSPNSSFLWIQYMSFQLQLSEVEKAREIGRRALKTISFREEQEKLNVWIGLLNLENVYGTDETMETMFKDASRHNDSKTIHLRLASIFDQTEKHEVSRISAIFHQTCHSNT